MDVQNCPRHIGLQILTRKWSHYLLRALATPKTFSELQHEYTVITNHILSNELHKLLDEKLIEHVEEKYRLTAEGKSLLVAVEPLHRWAVKNRHITACPKDLACSDCAQYNEHLQKLKTQ